MTLSRALVLLCFALALPLSAQQPAHQTATSSDAATIVFRFNWNQGLPWLDYTFTVQQNGATHFSGTGNPADSGDGDSFQQDFLMSEANLRNVFEWAKGADYFQGQFETRTKNVAKTGTKTLEYHGPPLDTSATYNYSPNPNIQQLTKLFQSIAMTLDYGRKLAFQYRFDKLGMDTRLNQLVDLNKDGRVEELQAIEPILRRIADDDNLMHLTRMQARQLLKAAGPSTTAEQPAAPQR